MYLETVFPDGATCPALLSVNKATRKTARDLGYADTIAAVRQMHFEHELAHTYIAEKLGWRWSKVLRRVALKEPWTFDEDRDVEENLALAFQRYLNTEEIRPLLARYFSPCRLSVMAADFKTRFRKKSS